MSGNFLLSHRVPPAVPSALKGLASRFGMELGVSLLLWSPKLYGVSRTHRFRESPDRFSRTAQWTRSNFVGNKPSAY